MPRQPVARTRRARGSLSADEILDAAEKIVERHGLDQLSMPTLARSLGCGVTSVYWYFRSKDELVGALVDRVTRSALAGLPPVGHGAWDDEIVAYYTNFRELMHRTPLYREIFAHSMRVPFAADRLGRQVLRRTDAGLALLTQAGFTPQQAAVVHSIFSNYTMGFITRESAAYDEDDADAVNARIIVLGAAELPVLSQVDNYGSIRALSDEQFVNGLRLLVQGARRELDVPEVTNNRRRSRLRRLT